MNHEDSPRRERFIRVAEQRVNAVLVHLDRLARCSDRRNYEYDKADVGRIFAALEKRVAETKECFVRGGPGAKEFTLT